MNELVITLLVLVSVMLCVIVAGCFVVSRIVGKQHALIKQAFDLLAVEPRDRPRVIADASTPPKRHTEAYVPPNRTYDHKPMYDEIVPLTSDGGRGPE